VSNNKYNEENEMIAIKRSDTKKKEEKLDGRPFSRRFRSTRSLARSAATAAGLVRSLCKGFWVNVMEMGGALKRYTAAPLQAHDFDLCLALIDRQMDE
jgi:hypothetical protein